MPNSPENRAEFDGPSNDAGPGAFPQVRLLVHAECGTKAPLNAGFDGYRTAETVLTGRLFDSFGPGMLVLADRNFLSWKLWRDAAATKAELLWRVSDSFTLPVRERLPDGSYLSRLKPPRKKDGDPITVRVIEYSVSTRDEHGATTSELFCLATTLLDPKMWPIEEFPALYHERWRVETLLDAVKTDLRGGPGHPDPLAESRGHPAGDLGAVLPLPSLGRLGRWCRPASSGRPGPDQLPPGP